MKDFNLERFVEAQKGSAFYGSYEDALNEIRAGRKFSHWMWYVFPQVKGLGKTKMSHDYALSGVEEARAYLDHPVLGPRLREICNALMQIEGKTAHEIMGSPDDKKLRSSMTLFDTAADTDDNTFSHVLTKYYHGEKDFNTLLRLRGDTKHPD